METVTKLTKIRRFVSFVSVLNRIPVRYEQVIAINGYALAPDVTVLSCRQEQFIWEHCGRTGNVKYMKRHKWKLELYESAGIVPWRNLIITYDNEEGMIDISAVENEIRNKLLA